MASILYSIYQQLSPTLLGKNGLQYKRNLCNCCCAMAAAIKCSPHRVEFRQNCLTWTHFVLPSLTMHLTTKSISRQNPHKILSSHVLEQFTRPPADLLCSNTVPLSILQNYLSAQPSTTYNFQLARCNLTPLICTKPVL